VAHEWYVLRVQAGREERARRGPEREEGGADQPRVRDGGQLAGEKEHGGAAGGEGESHEGAQEHRPAVEPGGDLTETREDLLPFGHTLIRRVPPTLVAMKALYRTSGVLERFLLENGRE